MRSRDKKTFRQRLREHQSKRDRGSVELRGVFYEAAATHWHDAKRKVISHIARHKFHRFTKPKRMLIVAGNVWGWMPSYKELKAKKEVGNGMSKLPDGS